MAEVLRDDGGGVWHHTMAVHAGNGSPGVAVPRRTAKGRPAAAGGMPVQLYMSAG